MMCRALSRWFTAPFLTLLALSGCALGPDFAPPELTPPSVWHPPGGEGVSGVVTDPALSTWWTTFDDSQLVSLIERAVHSNLDLGQAQARLAQARAAREATASILWPRLDLSGQARREERGSDASRVDGNEGGESTSNRVTRRSFGAGLDLSWELDLFGGQRRSLEASAADEQNVVEQLRNTQVSLVAEVATHYIALRGLQQRLAVARRNLELQERSADIARRRYEAGFVSKLDVVNAEADLAATTSQIPELESAVRQEMYALAALLGREPMALVDELNEPKSLPAQPKSVPVGIPADLLRRRPDIRSAEAALHAETARIGVAVADLFPRLSLNAALGLQGESFSALGRWEDRLASLGGGVVQPLFDGGQRRANVRRQEAAQQEALLRYHSVVVNSLREVESALTALQREQSRQKILEDAVRFSEQAREIALSLYTAGSTDFLNVVSAERALFAAENALTVSRQAALLNLVVLYKALGGGWEEQSGDQSAPSDATAS